MKNHLKFLSIISNTYHSKQCQAIKNVIIMKYLESPKLPLWKTLKRHIKKWPSNGILIKIPTINKKLHKNSDKSPKHMKSSLINLKEKLTILTDLMLQNMEQVSISTMLMISSNISLKTLDLIIMMTLTSLEVFSVVKKENLD